LDRDFSRFRFVLSVVLWLEFHFLFLLLSLFLVPPSVLFLAVQRPVGTASVVLVFGFAVVLIPVVLGSEGSHTSGSPLAVRSIQHSVVVSDSSVGHFRYFVVLLSVAIVSAVVVVAFPVFVFDTGAPFVPPVDTVVVVVVVVVVVPFGIVLDHCLVGLVDFAPLLVVPPVDNVVVAADLCIGAASFRHPADHLLSFSSRFHCPAIRSPFGVLNILLVHFLRLFVLPFPAEFDL